MLMYLRWAISKKTNFLLAAKKKATGEKKRIRIQGSRSVSKCCGYGTLDTDISKAGVDKKARVWPYLRAVSRAVAFSDQHSFMSLVITRNDWKAEKFFECRQNNMHATLSYKNKRKIIVSKWKETKDVHLGRQNLRKYWTYCEKCAE